MMRTNSANIQFIPAIQRRLSAVLLAIFGILLFSSHVFSCPAPTVLQYQRPEQENVVALLLMVLGLPHIGGVNIQVAVIVKNMNCTMLIVGIVILIYWDKLCRDMLQKSRYYVKKHNVMLNLFLLFQ